MFITFEVKFNQIRLLVKEDVDDDNKRHSFGVHFILQIHLGRVALEFPNHTKLWPTMCVLLRVLLRM